MNETFLVNGNVERRMVVSHKGFCKVIKNEDNPRIEFTSWVTKANSKWKRTIKRAEQ